MKKEIKNTKKEIKKIGILTSGGDCSGLNAVITATVKCCEEKGIEIYGIHNGTDGLLENKLKVEKLSSAKLSNANFTPMRSGGTFLKSKNADSSMNDKNFDYKGLFKKGCEKVGLNSIIVVGGDGSAMITADLVKDIDINIVCVPKTIDNDTPVTDYSIGFDTATNVTMNAMDMLQSTAYSHSRTLIVEIMGRDAGHLALHTAIAGDACVCLIPEIPYKIEGVIKKLKKTIAENEYALIVVAEGCKTLEGKNSVKENKNGTATYKGFSDYISKEISDAGYNNKNVILGHIQRGGIPTAYDRITAAKFAVHAVNTLCSGKNKRMVVLKDGGVKDVDLYEAVESGNRPVSRKDDLLKTAEDLGIYIGEK